jgi:ferric-dicitrate binding protein FerR (iron transport regulator)
MEPISRELIQKYLSGACSPEEENMVLNWYNSFESKADPYDQLSVQQQQELRLRMLMNIELGLTTDQNKKTGQLKLLKYIGYSIAAAAAILLFIKIPGFLTNQKMPQQANDVQSDEIMITNHTQTIYKQVLPDRSIVWLSPGAQISYHKKFQRDLREVNLSGESFFEVTKDKAHSFVIYSDHITTRVWGTSFRIHDIKNASTAEVAVVTGKVSVVIANRGDKQTGWFKTKTMGENNVMLLPRQKVVYEGARNNLKVDSVTSISSLSMWNKANLSFEKTSLRQVIHTLNKQFNVEIELQDKSLNGYILQADFSDQSLPDIMEMLKKLLKLTYVTDGKKFTLQKAYSN